LLNLFLRRLRHRAGLSQNVLRASYDEYLAGVCYLVRYDAQHYDTEHNDIQYNETEHNDIQHNGTQHNGLAYQNE
jgi:hypothetical protein